MLIFSATFVASCSYLFQGQMEIQVTANHVPLAQAQLILYGKKNEKEIFIQNLSPDPQGKVAVTLDFSHYDSFQIAATSASLDPLYLPMLVPVNKPAWWQEQRVHVDVAFQALPPSPVVAQQEPEIKPSEPLVEKENTHKNVVRVSQFEHNVVDAPAASAPVASVLPVLPAKPKEAPKSMPHNAFEQTKKEKNEKNKTITENKKTWMENVAYRFVTEQKPLAGVVVYTGYNESRTVIKQGATGKEGDIRFSINRATAPDVLIFLPPNGVAQVVPFVERDGEAPYIFDVKAGKSLSFFVQYWAYGLPRGYEKTEIFDKGAKVFSSNKEGFVTLEEKENLTHDYSLSQLDSISSSLPWKLVTEKTQKDVPSFFLPPKIAFKPTVGLIEPEMKGELEVNALWRRARREFFSRFINETSFKTKIKDDLFKFINGNSMENLEVFKHGWAQAPYAKDVDILLQIQLKEEGDHPQMVGSIFAKSGEKIFEQIRSLGDEDAEKQASLLYQTLLEKLPLEGNLVSVDKQEGILNLGSKQHVQKGDVFALFSSQDVYGAPIKPIGIFNVTDVSPLSSNGTFKVKEMGNEWSASHTIRALRKG